MFVGGQFSGHCGSLEVSAYNITGTLKGLYPFSWSIFH
jgi:hypothetical protein